MSMVVCICQGNGRVLRSCERVIFSILLLSSFFFFFPLFLDFVSGCHPSQQALRDLKERHGWARPRGGRISMFDRRTWLPRPRYRANYASETWIWCRCWTWLIQSRADGKSKVRMSLLAENGIAVMARDQSWFVGLQWFRWNELYVMFLFCVEQRHCSWPASSCCWRILYLLPRARLAKMVSARGAKRSE